VPEADAAWRYELPVENRLANPKLFDGDVLLASGDMFLIVIAGADLLVVVAVLAGGDGAPVPRKRDIREGVGALLMGLEMYDPARLICAEDLRRFAIPPLAEGEEGDAFAPAADAGSDEKGMIVLGPRAGSVFLLV
jgi:hypothetical protein